MGLVTGTVSPEDLGLCRVVMGIEAAARGMSESGGMARVVPGDRIRHAGTASTNVRFGDDPVVTSPIGRWSPRTVEFADEQL